MKKNKKDQAYIDGENEAPPEKIKKRSSALFRGMTYFFFFIFLLIVGAGVVLEYFFPAEKVRELAEKEGTKQLNLPLSIEKIKFSLLSGVRIDGVTLGPAAQPIANVKALILDYDLSQLLQGQIIINQILVDQPELNAISKNGVWNFQPLLNLSDPANTSSSSTSPDSGSGLPLPLAGIDLQELTIRNASAKLDMDGNLFASIKGLNLEAKGKADLDAIDLNLRVLMEAGPTSNIIFKQQKEKQHFQSHASSDLNFSTKDLKNINISGNFDLQQNQIRLGDVLPSPNLKGNLSAKVQLEPELINLSAFSLIFDDKNEIRLSTKVKNFSTSPEVELNIQKVSFQLADILRWGAKWIPPLSGHGTLKGENLNIMARLPGFKLDAVSLKGGLLTTENLTLKSADIQIEKLNSSLQVNEVVLKNGKPEKVSADLKMQLAKVQAQEAKIQNWKQTAKLTASGSDLSQVAISFSTDIESFQYSHPVSNQIHLPFHTEGSLKGDWKRGDIELQKISYRSGNMIQGEVSGKVKQKKSFQLQKNLTLDISQILKVLPKEISEKIPQMKASGQTQVALSFAGELDTNFQPANITGNTQVSLIEFSAKLGEPVIQIDDLNTTVQFPLVYMAEQGVKISTLDIDTTLKKLSALGNWNLDNFAVSLQLTSDAFYNLKSDFGTLPVKLDSQIKFGNLYSEQPALSFADFNIETHLKGDLQPDDFRNGQLDGEVSFKDIKALEELQVGKINTRFSLQMHDKSLSRIRLSQKTKITDINQLDINIDKITLETLTRKNLRDGNFDLDKLHFKAADLIEMQLKGSAKKWGESFALENTVDNLKLASLWEKIPADLKKGTGLTELDGTVGLSIKAQGNLPASEENIKPAERWTKIFSSLGPDNLPPLEVATRFQLQNGKVNHPEKGVRANGLNLDTRLSFKNGLTELSGNTVAKIHGMDFFEKLPLHPEFKFNYRLKNLNTLILAKHQLHLKNRGVRHTLEGKIDGLKSFMKGPLDPAKLLKKLNVTLKNENNLNIAEATKGELFGDIKATGALSSQFQIHQSAGKSIDLKGQIGFNRFAAEVPTGVALKNLTGNFPFSKSLSLNPNILFSKSTSPAQKRFFKQLRGFSRYKNNIQADSLEVAGQKISNIGMDIVFKDNRLAADKFIFDILGGTVGGHFSFTQTEKGSALKFSTEFAKIDSSQLLPSHKEENIDSKIDGNMEVAVETAEVSLDKLRLKIAITRIGTKTLDRLLLFIDPEESKPAIVDTRAKLKLAAPHRVLLSLANGNLDVEVWLKSDLLGIIKAPELKRIPVAGLKQFAPINKQLQSFQEVLQILKIIAAKGIAFENEALVVKY
ncbi:MAG: hypothetical protein ACI8PD_000032 [Nitrospinales bacterium]|jgi:hypothetical protein